VLILALTGSLCYAAKAQTQFGVQGGVLLNSITQKYDGEKEDGSKPAIGFKVGAVSKIHITDAVSFNPELNFIFKGGKNEVTRNVEGAVSESKITISPYYLEVPLNVAYNAELGNGNLFFGVGPVVSFGLGGKVKAKSTITYMGETHIEEESGSIKFDGSKDSDDENSHLKRLELSANLFVGYQLSNGFFAKAFFNQGISNLSPIDKSSFRNTFFGIGVGILFGGSSTK
jgi:hypothetical protein